MPLLALGLTLAAGGLVLAFYLGRSPYAILPSLAGAAMLGGGLVGQARAHRAARAVPSDAPPVPPPSAATLAELAEPITACPRCGSLEVLPVILADRGGHEVTCSRCDYVGEPLHFLRRVEYRDYVRGLADKR
jgi:ribosomal protein S27AE